MKVSNTHAIPLEPGVSRGGLPLWCWLNALRVLTVASALGVLPAVWLWWQTVRACLDTYFFRNKPPMLFSPEAEASWYDILVGLDMSSCSALVVVLLLVSIAVLGGRNAFILPSAERERFRSHAYTLPLFPKGLSQLCVNLGLIGTLISFLLAPIYHLGTNHQHALPGVEPGLAQAVAQAQPGEVAAPAAPPRQLGGPASQPLFLLLCAALVSTLVGTVAAFLIMPSLEWLNSQAMGEHLAPEIDPDVQARRVCDAMQYVVERLEAFAALIQYAEELGRRIGSLDGTFAGLEARLHGMTDALAGSSSRLEHAAAEMAGITQALQTAAAEMGENSRELGRLPDILARPVNRLETATALAVKQLEQLVGTADDKLSALARSVLKPVDVVHRVVENALAVVAQLHHTVELMRNHPAQSEKAVEKVAAAFGRLETTLGGMASHFGDQVKGLREHEAAEQKSREKIDTVDRLLQAMNERHKEMERALEAERRDLANGKTRSEQLTKRIDRLETDLTRELRAAKREARGPGWLAYFFPSWSRRPAENPESALLQQKTVPNGQPASTEES